MKLGQTSLLTNSEFSLEIAVQNKLNTEIQSKSKVSHLLSPNQRIMAEFDL